MATTNILYGSLMVLVSGVFLYLTFQFPAEQRGLDPRVYPRFITLCLMALSLGLLGSGIKAYLNQNKVKVSGETGEGGDSSKAKWWDAGKMRLWGMILISAGYVSVIEIVGYLVATPPYVVGTMVLFGERRIVRILLISVFVSAILFWLFRIIFRVPLPVSVLW